MRFFSTIEILLILFTFDSFAQSSLKYYGFGTASGNVGSGNSSINFSAGNNFSGSASSDETLYSSIFTIPTEDEIDSSVINLASGWNLISIPLQAESMHKDSILAGASSQVYGFDNSYFISQTLETGKGYWVKFDDQEFIKIGGLKVNHNIQINEGWNLIGPFNSEIGISDISTQPASILTSQFFSFNWTYTPSDLLLPGRGYWIKSSANGEIIFGGGMTQPSIAKVKIPEDHSVLLFTNSEATAKLYLFEGSFDKKKFELPPEFEGSALDVRFTDGTFAANNRESESVFKLNSDSYPVKIKYVGENELLIQNASGENEFKSKLKKGSEIEIKTAEFNELKISTIAKPTEFTLYQNYPNPFNPTTNIKFDLPESGNVKMIIYDVIGREIVRAVNSVFEAGSHKVEFSGTILSSGVYFYRLTFESVSGKVFTKTKKLLMVK